MKSTLFIFCFLTIAICLSSQENAKVHMDSSKVKKQYSPVISVQGRYYFDALKNTRTDIFNSGFLLDKDAFEYQLKILNLPKLFYYQQLGTLTAGNYVSVTGFGLKDDFRFPVFKDSWFILTPYVEIGGGYYKMNIVKGVTVNTISTVLNSQIENYYLDNFVLSTDVGLDLGFRFKVVDQRYSLVFNGGYVSNIPTEWRLASSLAFKEKINIKSPYAGIRLSMEIGK